MEPISPDDVDPAGPARADDRHSRARQRDENTTDTVKNRTAAIILIKTLWSCVRQSALSRPHPTPLYRPISPHISTVAGRSLRDVHALITAASMKVLARYSAKMPKIYSRQPRCVHSRAYGLSITDDVEPVANLASRPFPPTGTRT
jgi:hypothetical protein